MSAEPVPCKDCGMLVERKYAGRGPRPQRCEACREKHKQQGDRERQIRFTAARRRALPPCPDCGGNVEVRSHRRTPYCAKCYAKRALERQRAAEQRQRWERGRQCSDCGQPVPYAGKRTPRRCTACRKKRQRGLQLASQWSISHEEYDVLLASQGHVCGVCGTSEPGKRGWFVDHDHSCCAGNSSCGKCIRGLLCVRCNMLLGYALDQPETLERAAAYLRRT